MTNFPPLTFAALWGWVDVVELLLGRGAEVNAEQGDGHTALPAATFCDGKDIVKL